MNDLILREIESSPLVKDEPEAKDIVFYDLSEFIKLAKADGYFKGIPPEQEAILLKSFWDIIKSHKWIKIKDVSQILNKGLKGQLGEFFSINSQTVNSWCNKYRDYKASLNRVQTKEPDSQMTEEQKKQLDKEILQIFFDGWPEFQAHGKIPKTWDNYRFLYYRWFEKAGIINIPLEEKKKVFGETMGKIRAECRGNKYITEDEILQRTKRRCQTQAFEKALLKCFHKKINLKDYADKF